GALVARPLVAASRAVFGVRLGASRRFTWFRKEMATVTGVRRSFLGAGLRLTIGGDERANATLVQRVLTLALLHDLQAATRTSVLSPMRRRRVTPFVVLLPHVTAGSLAHRFLDALAALEDDDLRRHTLLVLATPAAGDGGGGGQGHGEGDPGDPVAPPGTPTYGPRDAATALAPLAERGVPLAARTIRVDVPGPPSGADEQRLQIHRVVQPMPVAGAVAIPLLAALVLVAATTAAVVPAVDGDGPSRCPEEVGGEMIGVGDGTDGCSFFPGAEATATEVDDAMVAAEETIAHENAAVLADGEPYSTIVFFAPLTIPPGQGRQGENALNQLRGTALAQQRANRAAVGDPKRVMTRVLLANPGDRFVHGEQVARQIVERAAGDATIVGVVGISQSRTASRDAVRLLGDHRLPVVAGPVTGDVMVDASPHYYQVSPRNKRVASVLVAFSTHTAIVSTADDGAVIPDGAVIVMDHSDEYSRNLADDLHEAFTRARRTTRAIVTYPIEAPDAPVPDAPAGAPEPVRVGSSDELAEQVCSSLGPRDIVFYASRSQQFVSLLQSMHDDNHCPDAFTVVGGSALTKIVEDPSNPLAQYGVSLYYAAFAARDVTYNRAGREFMDLYESTYGQDVIAPDISDGAVAYDAFNGLQRTANYAVQNDLPISADTSAGALGSEQIEFDGASGYIALGNGPIGGGDPRVPPTKPVLVLPAGDAPDENTLACGRYTEDDERTTWGPDRADCPAVD
ncbi:MAG TPA: ABC transporter substrate-binding protein, partial [Acidimicrobiales bacterium]|nr:ABC transporter substrate-binding protein [Acidimicrobiales bacterium]